MTPLLLANDTAIVTGAARRIGYAIAEALAREGARVLMTDILADEGAASAKKLADAGLKTDFLAGDLCDPQVPNRVVDHALALFGTVSLFVHCASPRHRSAPIFEIPEDEWDRMLDVNIKAGYRMAGRLGQQMRDRGIKGRMLFISSLHASTPRGAVHYSVAKAGMSMLVQESAKALGPAGIRVNAIVPGTISSDWWEGVDETAKTIALRRIGRPEEVASTAVALLSERFASFVTGTTIVVDGGQSLFNWCG